MSRCEQWRESIPWYVNGTLDDADRGRLRRHVDECDDCSRLLDHARLQAEHGTVTGDAEAAHVPAALLVRFVEARARVEVDTAAWIATHLEQCDRCAADAGLVRDAGVATSQKKKPRLRERFAALLQPAPAMVYLLLLAIAAPFVWRGLETAKAPGPSTGDAPRVLDAPAAPLLTEPARRGEAPIEPVEIRGQVGLQRVDLDLEWTRADLADVPTLRIELRGNGEIVRSLNRVPSELGEISEGLRITLWVDYGESAGERVYEWLVRAEQPGGPLDGQVLFRRGIRVVP